MRYVRGLIGFACLLAAVALAAPDARAERRVALVIGNAAYKNVPVLANPKNDALLMTRTLQAVGFEVTTLIDADQAAMKRAMLDFGRKLRAAADVGLFYYSGHGVQVRGENYLVPVDAALKDESEVDLQAVDVNAFLRVMDGTASKGNIVILDACRNDPFASSFRSVARGLAMVDAPRGTYIAYSTAPGQVAEDGTGGDSPYTQAVSEAIAKQGLKLEDTFKEARRIVLAATDNKQVPWETTSITGDFYFQPPAPPAPEPPREAAIAPEPVTPPPAAETPAMPAITGSFEANRDRPGLDYKYFAMTAAQPAMCQIACMSDRNCRAWTYVNPKVQGPTAFCWLKKSVPAAMASTCCTSGVK